MSEHHTTHANPAHDSHAAGHVVPLKILVAVWGALVVFTVVTVIATWRDFGDLNIWIAMGIATFKASLVALYFMHLRYDSFTNSVVFLAALLFLLLFIGLSLMDVSAYFPDQIPGYAPDIHP